LFYASKKENRFDKIAT
jgi:hypothetical protein